MGKPYAKEVESLQGTYRAAIGDTGGTLVSKFMPLITNPLIAVGSGGSLTAAHLASLLHVEATGELARAMTPLETTCSPLRVDRMSIIFLTAGGSNADILGSYRHLMRMEPSASLIVCARQKSQLAKLAIRHPCSRLIEFDLPSGKDGFLATNSLLATAITLIKGYGGTDRTHRGSFGLPDDLEELMGWEDGFNLGLATLRSQCLPIWDKQTTVLLHGYWSQPAAVDFESKFTEASIGHLQIADYRHFAHGRHNWIGQRPEDCAVISLEAPQDRGIAEETLALIPEEVPRIRIQMRAGGAVGALEAIVYSLCLAQLAGEARGVDPGRPDVSDFGRALYHLNTYKNVRHQVNSPASLRRVAIERKAGLSVERLKSIGTMDSWMNAYEVFVNRIRGSELAGIVLDYDGTMIGCGDRDAPISKELSAQLIKLLELGLKIGVATGRGDSVHAALRSALPTTLAKSVLIGFHNGAIISPLSEEAPTALIDKPSEQLRGLYARLQANLFLKLSAKMKLGCGQITIFPHAGVSRENVWYLLRATMEEIPSPEMNVWRSSHSIDVVPATVSKRLVVSHIRGDSQHLRSAGILCIGDMGNWPGNDHDLLREPLSLSVDEVSPDPNSCWRLSPEGVRGVEATLWYLDRIGLKEGKVFYDSL